MPFFDPWSVLGVFSVGSVLGLGAVLQSLGEWWLL